MVKHLGVRLVTWPWKLSPPIWYARLILNSVALVPPAIFCPQMPLKNNNKNKQKTSCFCLCSFTSWLLQLSPVWLSLKQTTKGSKQRCSPYPKSSQNWLYISLSSPWFFPLTGCPLIHRYSTNSLFCATTASTRPLLAILLNSLKFEISLRAGLA